MKFEIGQAAKAESPFKVDSEDNGNCRVYYRRGKALYCYQLDRPGVFHFFVCSGDGEPSYQVTRPENLPLPAGITAIGRELIAFLHGPS